MWYASLRITTSLEFGICVCWARTFRRNEARFRENYADQVIELLREGIPIIQTGCWCSASYSQSDRFGYILVLRVSC